MEQVATVEPAVPQDGSAAPSSSPSAPDFGALYRAHVERRPPPTSTGTSEAASQSGVSKGDAESSAADEQQASSTEPRAGATDTDGTGSSESPEQQQEKLSRSQRKALRAQQSATEQPNAGADTSASEPDADPVARVERALDTRLAKLESLLQQQAPPSDSDQAYATTYAEVFGDDAEYARRAQIAVARPADLSIDEQDELAGWAQNRRAAELRDVTWKRNLSAVALSTADRSGMDPQAVVSAASPDAIFAAFIDHGRSLERADAEKRVAEITARADKLEQANRLLADENEALTSRTPAGARRLVVGGISAVPSPDGPRIDREKANGRQLLAAGLERRARQTNGTRRGATGVARGGR